MIRRPPRSTLDRSSAASDVYKRQAYDDDSLLPSLVNDLGKEAVAVVLAHEFGHAVQALSLIHISEPTRPY